MNKAKTLELVKKYTMIIVLILVTSFFAWRSDGAILLPMNVSSLISQNAYVFILATGMLLCILTGGNIDLSVGSVVCFVGAVGAILMQTFHVNVFVTILAMFVVGALIGAWQGFWIAFVRIPPFIVTLAGMLIFRGLSNAVLDGKTINIKSQETFVKLFGGGANCYIPDFFHGNGFNITCMVAGVVAVVIYVLLQVKNYISRKKKGYETGNLAGIIAKTVAICAVILVFCYKLALHKGIPSVLVWVLVVVLVYGFITSNTTVGRHFYAVGGNEKATKLSGINTNRVYFLAYMNMGFLSALAGMVTIARMTASQPTLGTNYEMDAIASCFIGGASAYGGIGKVSGMIIGAVLMGVINQGMGILGVDSNYQKVVKGIVLLIAVMFDVLSKRQKR